jgi:hypothetical protein
LRTVISQGQEYTQSLEEDYDPMLSDQSLQITELNNSIMTDPIIPGQKQSILLATIHCFGEHGNTKLGYNVLDIALPAQSRVVLEAHTRSSCTSFKHLTTFIGTPFNSC